MSARRWRLSTIVYVYTASCVLVALAMFFLAVELHHAIRGRPSLKSAHSAEHGHRPPSSKFGPPRAGHRSPPPRRQLPTDLLVMMGIGILLLVSVTSLLFTRRLLRPLKQLENAALAFANGALTARADVPSGDEIGAVGAAFDEMASRSVKLLRAHEELLANVSHELKTPLTRMQLALDNAAFDEVLAGHAMLHEINLDVAELQTIVGDVLASLRLAMVDGLDAFECIDVRQQVRAAVQRFGSLYPTRVVSVDEPEQPVWMSGDGKLLRRAIDNLLDNARKYSKHDIDLRLVEDGDTLVLDVEDQGIGIAAEDLEHIFSPFFRADRSRASDTGGVGLGLNLVRRIVLAHGGTVSVRSVEGVGSTFRLEFQREHHADPG